MNAKAFSTEDIIDQYLSYFLHQEAAPLSGLPAEEAALIATALRIREVEQADPGFVTNLRSKLMSESTASADAPSPVLNSTPNKAAHPRPQFRLPNWRGWAFAGALCAAVAIGTFARVDLMVKDMLQPATVSAAEILNQLAAATNEKLSNIGIHHFSQSTQRCTAAARESCSVEQVEKWTQGQNYYEIYRDEQGSLVSQTMVRDGFSYHYQAGAKQAMQHRLTENEIMPDWAEELTPQDTILVSLKDWGEFAKMVREEQVGGRETYLLEIAGHGGPTMSGEQDITSSLEAVRITFYVWVDKETSKALRYQEQVTLDGETFIAYDAQFLIDEQLDAEQAETVFQFVLPEGVELVDDDGFDIGILPWAAEPDVATILSKTALEIAVPSALPDGYSLVAVMANDADAVRAMAEYSEKFNIPNENYDYFGQTERFDLMYGDGPLAANGIYPDSEDDHFFTLSFRVGDPLQEDILYYGGAEIVTDELTTVGTRAVGDKSATVYAVAADASKRTKAKVFVVWETTTGYTTLVGGEDKLDELIDVAASLQPIDMGDAELIGAWQTLADENAERINSGVREQGTNFEEKVALSEIDPAFPSYFPEEMALKSYDWVERYILDAIFESEAKDRYLNLHVVSYNLFDDPRDRSFVNLWPSIVTGEGQVPDFNRLQPVELTVQGEKAYLYFLIAEDTGVKTGTIKWVSGRNHYILISQGLTAEELRQVAESVVLIGPGDANFAAAKAVNDAATAAEAQRISEIQAQQATFVERAIAAGDFTFYLPAWIPESERYSHVYAYDNEDGSRSFGLSYQDAQGEYDLEVSMASKGGQANGWGVMDRVRPVETVEIQGNLAKLYLPSESQPGDDRWFLDWEVDGTPLSVSARQLSREELIQFAEGLRPVPPSDRETLDRIQAMIVENF